MSSRIHETPEYDSPADQSDASSEYPTFPYVDKIIKLADTDVPGTVTEGDEVIPVINRRGQLTLGPARFAIVEVIETRRPFFDNPTSFIPSFIARVSIYNSLGGKKTTDARGHISTEGSVEIIEIAASSGAVTIFTPTTDGEVIATKAHDKAKALQDFYDKHGLNDTDLCPVTVTASEIDTIIDSD